MEDVILQVLLKYPRYFVEINKLPDEKQIFFLSGAL